jgi:hypothetical protein
MLNNVKYLKVTLNYDEPDLTMIESLAALPGVVLCRRLYPDDPALFNLLLVVVEDDLADVTFENIKTYEQVEYAEITEKPEPR